MKRRKLPTWAIVLWAVTLPVWGPVLTLLAVLFYIPLRVTVRGIDLAGYHPVLPRMLESLLR